MLACLAAQANHHNHSSSRHSRALRSPIPHTLLNPEDGIECCVIVKDPSSEFKDKLAANPVPGFTKVIGVNSLKTKYTQYKQKIALAAGYDAFFADDRVIRMMPQLLGKVFYTSKKHPAPVSLDGKGWATALERARDATYMHLGWGQVTSVRVGRLNMTPQQVAANLMAAVGPAVNAVAKKWRGVQSIHLTAPGAVALPLYKALPTPAVDEEIDSDAELEFAPKGGAKKAGGDDEDSEGMSDLEGLLEGADSDDEEVAALLAESEKKAPAPGKAKGGKGAQHSGSNSSAAAGGAKKQQQQQAGSKRPRAPDAAPVAPAAASAPASKKAKGPSGEPAAAVPAAGAKGPKPASLLSRKGLADAKETKQQKTEQAKPKAAAAAAAPAPKAVSAPAAVAKEAKEAKGAKAPAPAKAAAAPAAAAAPSAAGAKPKGNKPKAK